MLLGGPLKNKRNPVHLEDVYHTTSGSKEELKMHISTTHLRYLPYECANCPNYSAATVGQAQRHHSIRHPNEQISFDAQKTDFALKARLNSIMNESIGQTAIMKADNSHEASSFGEANAVCNLRKHAFTGNLQNPMLMLQGEPS